MKIEKVKIEDIKSNPNNPRVIKDDKYKKLVRSIKEFPEMLEIRPIVVDEDMIVLGGNMRLKACKEAALKEVHIIKASELTENKIKTNNGKETRPRMAQREVVRGFRKKFRNSYTSM